MNEKQIERKLGIPPGSTLAALVALAEQVRPEAPWAAFKPLWLALPWLEPGATVEQMRYGTPRNVHPFAETGGDLHHLGFLMDRDLPTDERPIVYVNPKDEDDATQIVASNLRDFLGLVAISFAEVVSRGATDADWWGFRDQWYADEPARLQEMEYLSDRLRSIPGVVRPASPSRVANAYPDQPFRLNFEDSDQDERSQGPREADLKNNLKDAEQASVFAQRALEERRFDESIHHARCGMQHPAYRARCLYILATTYQRSGRKADAQSAAEALLGAWLDPAAILPPGVHPRKVIERDDLISLVEQLEGRRAAPLIERIRKAPEIDEPSGDFL